MNKYTWTCKYCGKPLKMDKNCVYIDNTDGNVCPNREDGKTEHDSITYTLEIGSRKFNFGHKPSYDKAVDQYAKYTQGMDKCVYMSEIFAYKLKEHIQRGNSIDDTHGKKLDESYNRWDTILNNFMNGRVTPFMESINKIKS